METQSDRPVIISGARTDIERDIGLLENHLRIRSEKYSTLSEKMSVVVALGESLDSQRAVARSKEDESLISRRISYQEELMSLYSKLGTFLTWVEPTKQFIYSISESMLLFVNRDDSIKALQECHRGNATRHRGGDNAVFPLMDNHEGMGKTHFAQQYIGRCQGLVRDSFSDSISNARTIVVTLVRGSLILDKSHLGSEKVEWESRLKRVMVDQVHQLISDGTLSGKVSRFDDCRTSRDVILRVIRDTRTPLFLAFDEIGRAFTQEDLSESDSVRQFEKFCLDVVESWILIPHFYFLLIGRGEFTRYIECPVPRNFARVSNKPNFKRIPLKMIRREKVREILKGTTKRGPDGEEVSLSDFYKDKSKTEDQLISSILALTNGHPRHMLQLFRDYHSLEAINEASTLVDPSIQDIRQWRMSLLHYQKPIRELFRFISVDPDCVKKDTCNLNELSLGNTMKCWTFEELANRAFLRWEGTTDVARLYASKAVMEHLTSLFLPFHDWIRNLAVDLAATFELCCWKRFQDIFNGKSREALEDFENWFGSLDLPYGLNLEHDIMDMPKITATGSGVFTGLEQATAHPSNWSAILQAMITHANSTLDGLKPSGPCCFLPQPQSSSSDAIFISLSDDLIIGLAVKCFSGTVGYPAVEHELQLFNQMFDNPWKAPDMDEATRARLMKEERKEFSALFRQSDDSEKAKEQKTTTVIRKKPTTKQGHPLTETSDYPDDNVSKVTIAQEKPSTISTTSEGSIASEPLSSEEDNHTKKAKLTDESRETSDNSGSSASTPDDYGCHQVDGKRETRRILIVCNSGTYVDNPNIQKKAYLMPPNSRFPNIDRVLLLNLSKPELRAEFFGVKQGAIGAENLELIVTKRGAKTAAELIRNFAI